MPTTGPAARRRASASPVLIVRARNEATTGRLRRSPFLLVILLAALAVGARVALLNHQSLWFDEIVSATLAKQPRRICFWVKSLKKRSTMLSQEALVGVK